MNRRLSASLLSLIPFLMPLELRAQGGGTIGLPRADAVGLSVFVVSQGPLPGGPTFGSVCEPFSCMPVLAEVRPDSQLRFSAYGGSGLPFVMLASFGTNRCQFLPGIGGALALAEPMFLLRSGVINPPIAHPCNLSDAHFDLYLRPEVPSGLSIALQVLAFDLSDPAQLRFAFSRAMVMSVN